MLLGVSYFIVVNRLGLENFVTFGWIVLPIFPGCESLSLCFCVSVLLLLYLICLILQKEPMKMKCCL